MVAGSCFDEPVSHATVINETNLTICAQDEWIKHWFVLSGSRLRFYKDAKAEEGNLTDGEIDVASCYQVVEASVSRNYGFKLKVH